VDWHLSTEKRPRPLDAWISSLGMTRTQAEVTTAYVNIYDYGMMTSVNDTVEGQLEREHKGGAPKNPKSSDRRELTNR
jgi:hypothetical protein